MFELRARNWRKSGDQAETSGRQIAEWMRQLKLNGADNYGYYPDDFTSDKSKMLEIRSAFSSYWHP